VMNNRRHTLKYIIIDLISASLAWILFNLFRKKIIESSVFGADIPLEVSQTLIISTLLVSVFWVSMYYFSGYYYNIYRKSRLQELVQTLLASLFGNIFLFFALILDDVISNYSDYYYLFVALMGIHFLLTYLPRVLLTSMTIKNIRNGTIGFNTLIIGSGSRALEIVNSYSHQNKKAGYRFVGFIEPGDKQNNKLSEYCPDLGHFDSIEQIIRDYRIVYVIVAIDPSKHDEIGRVIRSLQFYNVSIRIMPDLFEILIGQTELALMDATPLLVVSSHQMPVWERNVKEILDKCISAFLLIFFAPVFLFVAIGVKMGSKGPVIYKQKRVGLNGAEFTIYKFRSMYEGAEKNGPELSSSNDVRITHFGKFLRKNRLDELPQFYNVLKGDMSLVGPRPERRYFIDRIIDKAPEYMMLLKTKPGITSLGQVKYGYAENLEQMLNRLKFDIIYMKNMSLYLDFKILIFTLITLLKQNGK
jgi:exopolysaccharide biosynthesis polyprenyl glycosylphosphotransferase